MIPLGVDAETMVVRGREMAARAALRDRFNVGDQDIVVLFFGRLSFHAKAHPSPMYLALERAQARLDGSGIRLHMLMTGQFSNEHIEKAYHDCATRMCPNVPVHFIDGTSETDSQASWAAADIFLSLSDNIQESFGITPIEAMAAGLPCVVSDWDGYRDTVLHGETGFRVSTWMGAAGTGVGFAQAYDLDSLTYDRFVGGLSLVTAADVDQTAQALETLARDPDLRQRMGAAGIDRARTVYDWSVIIPQYQALWAELGDRRKTQEGIAIPASLAVNPALPDPAVVFSGYSTERISPESRVRPTASIDQISALFADVSATFFPQMLLSQGEAADLFAQIPSQGTTLADLLRDVPSERRGRVTRTVLWWMKFGAVAIA